MAVFQYRWGTERPRARGDRQDRYLGVYAEAGLARILAENEARVARFHSDVEVIKRDREIVRLSTPGGRYNSEVAATVAAQFGLASSDPAVKRTRGRPFKYGPNDPRPPRPSRAATPAGRLRAAAMVHTRKKRGSAARQDAVWVSPVTASPARSVAPPVATAVGRALLADTIAAKQDVVAPAEVVVSITQDAIVAAPAPPSVPELAAYDPAAVAVRHQEDMLVLLRELVGGQDMTADGQVVLGTYLRGHRRAHHVCAADWHRGQDGAKRHDYDFTDPADEAKVKPEIRALFKGFGLSRHSPSYDRARPERGMSEEDLQLWMKRLYFNDVDYRASDYEIYMRRYGSARDYYWHDRHDFEDAIKEERQRFRVWPFIEDRLFSVELNADKLARNEIDLTTAKARVMGDEIRLIGSLKISEQAIYRKIVDAMTWFDGFSRIELLEWAGDDITKDRMCRIHQGFPGWAFPKELHEDVSSGWIFEDAPAFDYQPPDSDGLITFAEADLETRVETLRQFEKLDFADIEL
jgi:hypothetical protein